MNTYNKDNDNTSKDNFSKEDNLNIDIEKIIRDLEYYEKLRAAILASHEPIINTQTSPTTSSAKNNNSTPKNTVNDDASATRTTNDYSDYIDLNTLFTQTNDTLLTLDSIKTQLCRFSLNPCQKEYFSYYISPLLVTIDNLSRVAYNIGLTSVTISESKTLCPDRVEIQKNLSFYYCIIRKCEEIYCSLEKNINTLICENRNTN